MLSVYKVWMLHISSSLTFLHFKHTTQQNSTAYQDSIQVLNNKITNVWDYLIYM